MARRLLVVWHSQGGTTQRLADGVVRGAEREGEQVEVRARRAFDADVEDLVWAEAAVFVTPENFGYMSGALKDFFDRTFYAAQGRLVPGLPYALVVKAGNDGTGAVTSIARIVRGYPLKSVAEPLVVRGDVGDDDVARAEELGQTVAAGLALGIW
jgi:multimeric flavodoxin WrbA